MKIRFNSLKKFLIYLRKKIASEIFTRFTNLSFTYPISQNLEKQTRESKIESEKKNNTTSISLDKFSPSEWILQFSLMLRIRDVATTPSFQSTIIISTRRNQLNDEYFPRNTAVV